MAVAPQHVCVLAPMLCDAACSLGPGVLVHLQTGTAILCLGAQTCQACNKGFSEAPSVTHEYSRRGKLLVSCANIVPATQP